MKTIPSILSVCLISTLASTVHAVPIVHVTEEHLEMHAEVTLEQPPGVLNTYHDSFSGSLFSGDHRVDAYSGEHYIPSGTYPGEYVDAFIEMNADFSSHVEETYTSYMMRVENDVYGVDSTYSPDPEKIITSVVDFDSSITIHMEFYLTGGDVSILFEIFNEGTFAPVTIALDDLTTSARLVDLTSVYPIDPERASATLLDGHSYRLNMMVSEGFSSDAARGADDDDIIAWMEFENASVVRVAEPSSIILLSAGIVGMGMVARMRRRGATRRKAAAGSET